eukprot:783290-Rhodomonas_salina.1
MPSPVPPALPCCVSWTDARAFRGLQGAGTEDRKAKRARLEQLSASTAAGTLDLKTLNTRRWALNTAKSNLTHGNIRTNGCHAGVVPSFVVNIDVCGGG